MKVSSFSQICALWNDAEERSHDYVTLRIMFNGDIRLDVSNEDPQRYLVPSALCIPYLSDSYTHIEALVSDLMEYTRIEDFDSVHVHYSERTSRKRLLECSSLKTYKRQRQTSD